MTRVAAATSSLDATADAVDACLRDLRGRLGTTPDHLVCVAGVRHALPAIAALVRHAFPHTALHGLISCVGVTAAHGLMPGGIAMFAIADAAGSYGSACRIFAGSPRGAARDAAIQATRQAGRAGETPALILVSSTPGHEEQVLTGIADAVGPHVPIVGGSAADDTIAGRWQVQGGADAATAGCVVSAWYPTCRIAHRFHSGYEPTGHTGIITAAEGRTVLTIDDRPAAQWYDQAIGGMLGDRLATGGTVLKETTLNPLGRVVGRIAGIPHYQLSHPERFTSDGGLALFTETMVGDQVVLMAGSADTLVERAGRVVSGAMDHHDPTDHAALGALLIYCAGCMLSVRERMGEVAAGVEAALGGMPFIGAHTFGEQGCFPDGQNRHGNLMIATVVLRP